MISDDGEWRKLYSLINACYYEHSILYRQTGINSVVQLSFYVNGFYEGHFSGACGA